MDFEVREIYMIGKERTDGLVVKGNVRFFSLARELWKILPSSSARMH